MELRDVETGATPEQGTTVRAAWDADELRIQVHAQDRDAWATITQRDGPLWEEEVVEVFLDPVGDGPVTRFPTSHNPTTHSGESLCLRCSYQAMVMKMFEMVSRPTVCKSLLWGNGSIVIAT